MSDYRSIEEAQGNWPDADSIERKRRQRELESLHDQLTAAQSRVEDLEREAESMRGLLEASGIAQERAMRERVRLEAVESSLTADNQRLRSLLTDCLPFVERFGEINFRVDADSIRMCQKRLELLEKIKGLQ